MTGCSESANSFIEGIPAEDDEEVVEVDLKSPETSPRERDCSEACEEEGDTVPRPSMDGRLESLERSSPGSDRRKEEMLLLLRMRATVS